MKALPPGWPFYLPVLPRPLLQVAETRFLPRPLDSLPNREEIAHQWTQHRVALVKQSLYQDLYCAPPGQAPVQTARSSLRRTGPLGLLLDLGASFWMVSEDPAPECRSWEESVGSNPATREVDLSRARSFPKQPLSSSHPFPGKTPHELSVAVDEIPWRDFDVVISVDIAVPIRLIRWFPQIRWVYFPADPGTLTAKRARRRPPEGFSTALTHTHRRFPVRPGLGPATVECPYSFQSPSSWDWVWPAADGREGVMIEHQTHDLLAPEDLRQLETLGTLRKPSGSVSDVASSLRRSKYYLRLKGGPLTGNGQVEAIMAGCLALGDPSTFVQRSLFTPATICRTVPETIEKIRRFEEDPGHFQKSLREQQAVAEFICFRRPAWELLQRIRQTR